MRAPGLLYSFFCSKPVNLLKGGRVGLARASAGRARRGKCRGLTLHLLLHLPGGQSLDLLQLFLFLLFFLLSQFDQRFLQNGIAVRLEALRFEVGGLE